MEETLKEYCKQACITRCRPIARTTRPFVEQEERRGGPTNGRLPSIRGVRSGCSAGPARPFGPLVGELFSAVVQIDTKGARRGAGPQNLQRPATKNNLTPSAPASMTIYAGLDPVALLRDIPAVLEQLAGLTAAAPASHPTAAPRIEQFLSSLRIA